MPDIFGEQHWRGGEHPLASLAKSYVHGYRHEGLPLLHLKELLGPPVFTAHGSADPGSGGGRLENASIAVGSVPAADADLIRIRWHNLTWFVDAGVFRSTRALAEGTDLTDDLGNHATLDDPVAIWSYGWDDSLGYLPRTLLFVGREADGRVLVQSPDDAHADHTITANGEPILVHGVHFPHGALGVRWNKLTKVPPSYTRILRRWAADVASAGTPATEDGLSFNGSQWRALNWYAPDQALPDQPADTILVTMMADAIYSVTDNAWVGGEDASDWTAITSDQTPAVPVIHPSITQFDLTLGETSPVAGHFGGNIYGYESAIAQSGHVSAARIVGYEGVRGSSPPANPTLLDTLDSTHYGHSVGTFSIPSTVELAAGETYTIELQVFEEGQDPATDAPVAYHDIRIVTRAADAMPYHWGRIVVDSGDADAAATAARVAFATDDTAAGQALAASYAISLPDDANSYQNYLFAQADQPQPSGFTSGGLDASNSWNAAVDITIGGVAYKAYILKSLFALTHDEDDGDSWGIRT